MTITENIFSLFVFGLTFPNPTDVRLLKVKYIAVMYLSFTDGPDISWLVRSSYTNGFPVDSPKY